MARDGSPRVYIRSNFFAPAFPLVEEARVQRFDGLLAMYFNTFLGATSAELFTYPMDVTKSRLHLQGEAPEKSGQGKPRRGMFGTALGMAREEGLSGLYAGLSAMIIRNLFFNGLRVVFYDCLRRRLSYVDPASGKDVLTVSRGFGAGCLAGCASQFIAKPLDIVLIRRQMEGRLRALGYPARVSNVRQALGDAYQHGGLRSLWKGCGPSCARAMLMTAGDTACYDLSKRHFMSWLHMPDGLLIQFLSSVSAGFAASALSTPTDVVNSRIMNQPTDQFGQGLHYKNAFDCYYKLISQEGPLAMYKGFIPCWVRIGPWSVVFWFTFENLRKLQGQTGF
ncbi:mitochondrial uncoupling protein 4C-like [Drosophila guanche]|uniref:Blast:Mitochondrial uncoupling protein 4 n=1 Tax=Drosophila guanche TaxID=7266 RepID=A0A3B0JVF1_DROGU|nr:mitochondrial uncoupling protein 4C-like [Drosophila guanche]SPP86077.1 blast:Mitochondrial uncoupling protein 4 [Drosophila guanche]